MRVTIIADDSVVGVDREFRIVDLSALDANIHAVQWDGAKGHVEYRNNSAPTLLDEITDYQSFIDAWIAAAPPPPTLAELKQAKAGEFKTEGVTRIAAQIPEWDGFERVSLLASVWNLFGGAPNAAQVLARDIYLYVRDTALPKLAALATQAELDTIDPAAADPFGDGTPWPT